MPDVESLNLNVELPIKAQNAGFFISRGRGIHSQRVIDSHELIFVHKGTLGMHEEDRAFNVCEGQTLLLKPGRLHGGTENFPPDLRFFWVHFDIQDTNAGSNSEELCIPQHATISNPDRLTELFRRFLDDQESDRMNPVSAGLLITMMLCEVAYADSSRSDNQGAAVLLAQRTQSYIKSHLDQPISTSIIAGELDCNPDYLGRIFTAVYGITVTEAIHKGRLRKARNLLLNSELTIDQISRSCGFDDTGYFRRLFRRHEGMSPMAYRRLYAMMHINVE
ncbi:MAG: helix-turn-helix transcriptional regulator [Armatimonadota bacterium]